MRAPGRWVLPIIAMLVGAGCSGAATDGDREATEQGRAYTALFYDREFDQLWSRFSPEMKLTFPTAEELARFAGHTVDELGAERTGNIEEAVTRADTVTVYSRSASFANTGQRMLVEWTIGSGGVVTGFVIRPAARDSAIPG
jgi:hypothetical protein